MGLALPRHFFYATIVFTMLISGMVTILSLVISGSSGDGDSQVDDLLSSQGGGLSSVQQLEAWNRTFNVFDDLTDDITTVKEDIEEVGAKEQTFLESAITLPVAFIQTSWGVVRFIFKSFGFVDEAFRGLATVLHLPTWIPTLIISLLVVMFIFSVITLMFGKEF